MNLIILVRHGLKINNKGCVDRRIEDTVVGGGCGQRDVYL